MAPLARNPTISRATAVVKRAQRKITPGQAASALLRLLVALTPQATPRSKWGELDVFRADEL